MNRTVLMLLVGLLVGAGAHTVYFNFHRPVGLDSLDGQLAWRQHDGGHTDGPNWKYFIPWADKFLKRTTSDVSRTR